MNIVGFHVFIIFGLLCCWLGITGRTAEWAWRDWGESRWRMLFLGWHFEDLQSLKRYHFWMSWIILAVILFIYGSFIYGCLAGY